MTTDRDDIIRMAREAGWNWPEVHTTSIEDRLERFAALVAAAERERIIAANAPEIERINAHLNEWARDRLARHGINPCPDCHGIGYDASGQLCACQENPSF